jgi:2-polyprenyl-6-methoxyphenol hydroxylase-like FAD-dependent oxidoreductase
MHSLVREQAGIAFEGGAYGESFVLADVRLEANDAVPGREVILFFSPAGLVVVAPLPEGIHRIVATVEDAPEQPSIEYVQDLLDSRGPQAARAVVREVLWGSRFRVHHRIAHAYRNRRMLLAGDAAHVHSPAGGQGMNTGMQDATVLAKALVTALAGNDAALDAYEASRKPVAQQVVALADRLTRMATAPRALRGLRNFALSILARVPKFRRTLAWQLSGLVYR